MFFQFSGTTATPVWVKRLDQGYSCENWNLEIRNQKSIGHGDWIQSAHCNVWNVRRSKCSESMPNFWKIGVAKYKFRGCEDLVVETRSYRYRLPVLTPVLNCLFPIVELTERIVNFVTMMKGIKPIPIYAFAYRFIIYPWPFPSMWDLRVL